MGKEKNPSFSQKNLEGEGLIQKIYQYANPVNPYSAVVNFSRQNLISVDVRLWRLKKIPAL